MYVYYVPSMVISIQLLLLTSSLWLAILLTLVRSSKWFDTLDTTKIFIDKVEYIRTRILSVVYFFFLFLVPICRDIHTHITLPVLLLWVCLRIYVRYVTLRIFLIIVHPIRIGNSTCTKRDRTREYFLFFPSTVRDLHAFSIVSRIYILSENK